MITPSTDITMMDWLFEATAGMGLVVPVDGVPVGWVPVDGVPVGWVEMGWIVPVDWVAIEWENVDGVIPNIDKIM